MLPPSQHQTQTTATPTLICFPMSIYAFTKEKLLTHGVHSSANGRVILSDKHLFLLFVKLERARRLADFCAVHSSVEEIASYTRKIGKVHLLMFAFLYIRFTEMTPRVIHGSEQLDNGDVRYIKDYGRAVSQQQIAIGEWATAMYTKYERHFFRAIYSNGEM